jgi:hypothetical protein
MYFLTSSSFWEASLPPRTTNAVAGDEPAEPVVPEFFHRDKIPFLHLLLYRDGFHRGKSAGFLLPEFLYHIVVTAGILLEALVDMDPDNLPDVDIHGSFLRVERHNLFCLRRRSILQVTLYLLPGVLSACGIKGGDQVFTKVILVNGSNDRFGLLDPGPRIFLCRLLVFQDPFFLGEFRPGFGRLPSALVSG